MFNILDEAPAELVQDLALVDGVLICSDARKGDSHLVAFLSRARRRGVTQHQFLPASEFARRFGAVAHRRTENLSKTQNYAVKLLQDAYNKHASDIHLANYGTYGVVQFRCMGMVRPYTTLAGDQIIPLIRVIYSTLCQQAESTFKPGERQDARIVSREFLPEQVHSVRVHTEPLECAQAEAATGTFMALRLLYDRTEARGGLEQRMNALGYGEHDISKFRSLTERTGAVFIAGPTGHGKSTVLKHLMEAQAEENPEKSLFSIEDPPEYPLLGVKQIKVVTKDKDDNLDPGQRGMEYRNAIAGAMRSDPDVIMVGEVRYSEAAVAAIETALTGHPVFTTIHANSAIGIITRMTSLMNGGQDRNAGKFADPLEYLCDHNVLAGLVYQRLVPVLCPDCKLPLSASHKTLEDKKHEAEVLPSHTAGRLDKTIDDLSSVHILGRGCGQCDHTGIIGQTVAAEVIVTNETFLRHIRRGDYDKAYTCWLKDMEGRTYIQHAIDGIAKGRLDPYKTELRLGVPLDFKRNTSESI